MKLVVSKPERKAQKSRLARGAWIETFLLTELLTESLGRASQGARGLKHVIYNLVQVDFLSRLARGAWIETQVRAELSKGKKSRLARGAWIETPGHRRLRCCT